VKPATALTYARALFPFVNFLERYDDEVGSLEDVDFAASHYLSHMFDCEKSSGQGRTFVSALVHFVPELHGSLPLCSRSLKAFGRLRPGGEGSGFSEEVWGLLLQAMHGEARLVCALSVDCFLRPSEWHSLRMQDVHIAKVHGQQQVSLSWEQSKTGANQGVGVERPWVAAALKSFIRARGAIGLRRRVFTMSRRDYDRAWKKAIAQVAPFLKGPHACRHAGASIAAANGRFLPNALEAVRVRGRWLSTASVRRYAKPHILPQVNAQLAPAELELGRAVLDGLSRGDRSLLRSR